MPGYHCHVEGYTEGPSTSQAVICFHMYQAHLGSRLSFPSVPGHSVTLTPSNTMASRHIPLGLLTLSKFYFIVLPLLSHVIPMSD